MRKIPDNNLVAMSRRCRAIMAKPMKEIVKIPFEDFESLYNSIQPIMSEWAYAAADILGFPQPKQIIVRCPSSRIKWAAHVIGDIIEFNLRTMFCADLTWLKGCIIHELCHFNVKGHTSKFWKLYEQKIKEAGIVDKAYDGWKKERDKVDDPFMFTHPGNYHDGCRKFNCILNTFFYKGNICGFPLRIDYKLLHNDIITM